MNTINGNFSTRTSFVARRAATICILAIVSVVSFRDAFAEGLLGDALVQQAVHGTQPSVEYPDAAHKRPEGSRKTRHQHGQGREMWERQINALKAFESRMEQMEHAILKQQPQHGGTGTSKVNTVGEVSCVAGPVGSVVKINTAVAVASEVWLAGQQQYMVLPKNDEIVSGEIVARKVPFQADRLSRMLQYVREGSTVLDIGANLGTYTLWFAHSTGPKGKVLAFEPQHMIFQTLCANVVINGHRNIKTLNMALSFKEGVAHMSDTLVDGSLGGQNYSAHADVMDHKINYGGRNLGEGGEDVRMLTLDSLNIRNISFIKIDVQGAEPLVIYGARKTIKREQPVVNFEKGDGFNVTAAMIRDMDIPGAVVKFSIEKFLTSIGYTLAETVGSDDHIWVPKGYEVPARVPGS